MSVSYQAWQTAGALMLSFILAFIIYILPVLLLIIFAVMLFLRRFSERRVPILISCAVLILWIAIAYAVKFI